MPEYAARDDIADFLAFMKDTRRASVHTLKVYRKALAMYAEYLRYTRHVGVRTARPEHVAGFVGSMGKVAPATIKVRLSAVKSFHKWLHAYGRATHNPAEIVTGPRAQATKRKHLSLKDVERLRDAAPTLRHRVVVALLYDCALRVSEAAGALVSDLNLETFQITVVGKGDKARTVPVIGNVARNDLSEWIARGADYYLLPSPQANGGHLDPSTLYRMLGDVAEYAGMGRSSVHPHALRHARGENLRRRGYEPFWIQRFMGHSRIDHTSRYVNPPIQPDEPSQPAGLPADLASAIHALAAALRAPA